MISVGLAIVWPPTCIFNRCCPWGLTERCKTPGLTSRVAANHPAYFFLDWYEACAAARPA
eukprot:2489589-Pyramimonas_sp.AAC.1